MEYFTETEQDAADLLTWGEGTITFSVTHDRFPAERYSWGGSRGMETEVVARIMCVKIGKLFLNRDQAIAAFGQEAVEGQELSAALKAMNEAEAAA